MESDAMRVKLARTSDAARISAQLADDDRGSRDDAMAEAQAAGWSVREIADVVELAPGYVHRVLLRLETDRLT